MISRPTSRLSQSFAVAMACMSLAVVALLMPWSQRDVEPINQTLAELIPPLTPYDMPPTEFQELVDDVSRTEKWFQSLEHAYIQTLSTRTQTANHVQRTQKELQGLFPDGTITPAEYPELMPVSQTSGVIAFDQHRIDFRQDSESMGIHFGQWDGEKMIGVRDPGGPQGVNYYYKANVVDCSFQLFHFFPFACNHSFWFMQGEPASFGAANLKCAGRLEFCGHDCVVLRTDVPRGNVDWIIGRIDHHIYGRSDGMYVWEFKNHREVENGVFWPMAETVWAFSNRSTNTNEHQLAFIDETTVDLFDTQNPPPESVYDFQLVKGTEVCDMRFEAVGVYPYDPDRTEDEWQKIIVFSAADSREAVEAKLAKYRLNCPAFIPAPSNAHHMGQPVRDFRIEAFPTVVEINRQGRIAGYSGIFVDSPE